jgi:hypothetical protein
MSLKPIYPAVVNSEIRDSTRLSLSLNGRWEFRVDPEGDGGADGWPFEKGAYEIETDVPGSVWGIPELAEKYPSYRWGSRYLGGCWFRRRFEMPDEWSGGRFLLKFAGVMPEARFWLNGRYLGFHRHVQAAFQFDVTDSVDFGDENELVVELVWPKTKKEGGEDDMRGGFKGAVFGIWGEVEIERVHDLRISSVFIRPRVEKELVDVFATIVNDGADVRSLNLRASVDSSASEPVELDAPASPNTESTISFSLAMPNCELWTLDNPFLHTIELGLFANGEKVDGHRERFGMRSFTFDAGGFKLNGEPVMLRFDSPEFMWSPEVNPLTDKALIRRRIETLKKLGFNGKRYHTHFPTRQEFEVADELGFLVHAEVPVISNFNETRPYPDNKETWRHVIKEFRNHPSLVIVSMGNETAQVYQAPEYFTYSNPPHFMKPDYHAWAREYYAAARELLPDHLLLAGTGLQGEFPDLPNDFETPHLWSRNFKWAYDGLTTLPIPGIKHLLDKAPVVIHEYGKTTIWPNPEEDALFEKDDMPLKNVCAAGRSILEEIGLESLLPRAIDFSRRLSNVCAKIMVERLRRVPNISGFHWHCAFRVGVNRGMADDLGYRIDPQFSGFIKANQPTALLIDRDFRGRTLVEGETVRLTLHISRFGGGDVVGGTLEWSVWEDDGVLERHVVEEIDAADGGNAELFKITFAAPKGVGRFELRVELRIGKRRVAENDWSFWRFPASTPATGYEFACNIDDAQWERDLLARFPALLKLDDLLSARIGIGHWRDKRTPEEFLVNNDIVGTVVADHWSDGLRSHIEKGGAALLVDRGQLPEDWVHSLIEKDGGYDIHSMFVPFRAGWDHGNATTIVEEHPVVDGFPHEGFGDLQFFAMINGAKTLITENLPGKITPIIRVLPIWRKSGPQEGPYPEAKDSPVPWTTENRLYLAESRIGDGVLLICSLRLTSDPAGSFLFDRMIEYLHQSSR